MTQEFLLETVEELQEVLGRFGISAETWGTGKAKTLAHLLEEVKLGEARLCEYPSPTGERLVREVEVACLEITREGRVLEEKFQLFYKDGRKRTRTLDSTAGEKLLPGETPEAGVRRLIETEFPVLLLQPPESVVRGATRFRESESESYPGLTTSYHLHFFTVELALELPPITVQESDKLVAYEWVSKATSGTD